MCFLSLPCPRRLDEEDAVVLSCLELAGGVLVLGVHEVAVTQQAGQKPANLLDVAVCLSQLPLCSGVSLGVWVLCHGSRNGLLW